MDADSSSYLERTLIEIRYRIEKFGRLSEADTKGSLIEPLLNALGWDVSDPDVVRREFKASDKDNPVDYALLINLAPIVLIEVKRLGTNLAERKIINQILSYSAVVGVKLCLLTDGNEFRIYDTTKPVDAEDKLISQFQILGTETLESLHSVEWLSKEKIRTDATELQAFALEPKSEFDINKPSDNVNYVRKILEKMVETGDEELVRLIRRRKPDLGPKIILESFSSIKIASRKQYTTDNGYGDHQRIIKYITSLCDSRGGEATHTDLSQRLSRYYNAAQLKEKIEELVQSGVIDRIIKTKGIRKQTVYRLK